MKKMFLWAIFIALAATSCTQNDSIDVQKNNPIKFSPTIGKQTRGTTGLPTNNPFGVTAYYKTADGTFDYTDDGSYFKNLKVSYSDNSWKSATTYYWPLQGSLKFVAYCPIDKATIGYSETSGVNLTGFTQDASGSVDLSYAATQDLKLGVGTPNPVVLTFNHALTMLNFTLRTDIVGMKFKIKQLIIKSLCNTGTFNALADPTWSAYGESKVDYTVYDNENGVLIYKGADYGDNGHGTFGDASYCYKFNTFLYVIPQAITSIQLYIKYDLLILDKVDKANEEKTITLTGDDWVSNQHVEYAMEIGNTGLTEITYTPVITDWGDETELPSPF